MAWASAQLAGITLEGSMRAVAEYMDGCLDTISVIAASGTIMHKTTLPSTGGPGALRTRRSPPNLLSWPGEIAAYRARPG
ncbi:MAG: hypothetical protein ACLQK8_17920 [Streptosporangiaceae bacterium]